MRHLANINYITSNGCRVTRAYVEYLGAIARGARIHVSVWILKYSNSILEGRYFSFNHAQFTNHQLLRRNFLIDGIERAVLSAH